MRSLPLVLASVLSVGIAPQQATIDWSKIEAETMQHFQALLRIDKGTFGLCRDCGEPIAEARLNAIPWTRVCITCKEKQKA